MSIQIQYLGFQLKSSGREYSYRLVDHKQGNREFVLSISNRAFSEHHFPYQDAAAFCYQKLQKALDEECPGQPLPHHSVPSDQELDEYMVRRRPAKKRTW